MVTSLALGDKIHLGDTVTLTLVAIEGDQVCFEIDSSAPDGHGLQVLLIEGSLASASNWWESN